jgi:hypothetical protein
MDLMAGGELFFNGEGCPNTIVDNNVHFINSHELSQVVLTESAATCWLNRIAASDVGKLTINEDRWNQMFLVQDFKFDSSSLGSHIKIFEEKLGKNRPMHVDVSFKDIKVTFGQYEVDMIVDYTLCMSWRTELLGSKELLYDELIMQSSANIRAESEILHIDLIEHKLNLDARGGNRDMPKRNSMDLTTNEYREFLEDMSFSTAEFKKWLNDVVLRGDRVKFPYNLKEFQTSLQFEKQKLHVMIDIEDKAYQYLEQALWNDDHK